MLASEALKVLCIGVGRYSNPALNLRYAAENASRLREAFASPGGCGVPGSNLRLLLDEEATSSTILSTIAEVASGCNQQDVLILYFSGHGEREGSSFFLLPSDADPENLVATGVEAGQLRDLLGTCQARGVLVILDCCKSAGLAEVAGGLFTTVGAQEFRLLLSASRAGQMSYEFESFRGTIFSHHLARVIAGDVPIGDRPGIVYFSDLFDFLANRLAEDLETLGLERTAQETVFAGTYARDPRLFILQRVALETLDAETPRYSKRFVRRATRRAIQAAVAALLLSVAVYYYYLDHARYFGPVASKVDGHDGSYLAILAGDPKFNALGFPHVLRVTDIPYSAFPAADRLAVPAFASDQDIDRRIEASLPSEWHAVLAGWRNDTPRLIHFVKRTDDENDLSDDPAGLARALDLLGYRAGVRGIADLEENVSGFAVGRTAAALRQLARLRPARALDLYEDGMNGEPANTRGLLEGLAGPCPGDAPGILEQNADVTYDKNQGRSLNVDPDPMRGIWWGAVFRSGCAISPAVFDSIYRREIYRDNDRDLNVILYAMIHPDPLIVRFVQNDLAINAAKILRRDKSTYRLDSFDHERRVWSDLRLLNAVNAGSGAVSLPDLMAYDLDKNVKLAAARMAVRQSGIGPGIVARAQTDLWIASVLVDAGWWDGAVIEHAVRYALRRSAPNIGTNFSDSLEHLLHMIRRRHVVRAMSIVKIIRDLSADRSTIVAAGRVLDELAPAQGKAARASPRTRFFSAIGGGPVRSLPQARIATPLPSSDAYAWYITHYDEGFDSFAAHMTDSTENTVGTLFRLRLSGDAMRQFERDLSDPDRKYLAAALLAAKGSAKQLGMVLLSKDVEVRQEGMNYAILNPSLASVLRSLPKADLARETDFAIERQITFQSVVVESLRKAPAPQHGLLLAALVTGAWEATPALRIWAAAYLAAIDGKTEDGAGELQLFDAH